MNTKVLFVSLVMLMLVRSAVAGDVNILIGSYHIPRGDYCEFNPGIGYIADNGVPALVYRNSECNTGLVLNYTDRVSERVSVSYGGAFGYSYSPVVPFASVQYALGEHAYVGVLPGFLVGSDSVIFYGVKF